MLVFYKARTSPLEAYIVDTLTHQRNILNIE